MTHHTGTRDEWLAARLELLEAEKELTRRNDELARRRRELPWVPVEKDYLFDTEDGEATLARPVPRAFAAARVPLHVRPGLGRRLPELLGGRRRLRRQHPHFEHHDVAFIVVSRAPLDKLSPTSERMGWDFPWVSSFGSDFNYDFHATIDPAVAPVEYNYKDQAQLEAENVAWREWSGEQPGMSAFALDGRRRVPHLLRLCPRLRRAVDDVAVARPGAARPQRRRPVVVPSPRRVPPGLTTCGRSAPSSYSAWRCCSDSDSSDLPVDVELGLDGVTRW